MATTAELRAIAPAGNGAAEDIAATVPYTVEVTIEGTATLLFHRWDNEAVASKAAAAKNSAAKKRDNIASYVYRCDNGNLGLPGEYVRQSVLGASRYRQDPRSSRKSALDLFKAAVIPLTELADLGVKDWDYIDRRRVTVQRAGITRERPALKAGWKTTLELLVQTPEYVDPPTLLAVLNEAGRLVGVGDFRPTFGRFQVTAFKVLG